MNECPQPEGPMAIEVSGLKLALGGQSILRSVDFKVPAGKVVALIGPNGSGKTTLLRCLVGLQKPDAGTIRLLGESDFRKTLPRIGYVPQRLPLDPSFILSVREFLSMRRTDTRHWFFHRNRANDDRLSGMLGELGLEDLLGRPLARLSGGQLQRVLIAFSLLNEPELLLLDEPTAGVDSPGENSFYELITAIHKRLGLTVVLVSHDLSMVYRHAHWVYALNQEICCEGPPEHVMNAESLKQAYGINVSPYSHHHEGHHHVH